MKPCRRLALASAWIATSVLMLSAAACHKPTSAVQPPLGPGGQGPGGLGVQSDNGPPAIGGSNGGAYGQQTGYAVPIPPPPLPTYAQPPPPQNGDVWTPGFWGWSDPQRGYYWTPGTWVTPPQPNVYWTPGYWRNQGPGYGFVPGYWGPVVGFYGGINYGWGYDGAGYQGGRWQNNQFYYNRLANNLAGRGFNRVYNQPVRAGGYGGVSFNGGPGGLMARPNAQQLAFARRSHLAPTQAQVRHFQMARGQPGLLARFNHGSPPIVATASPTRFTGRGVVTQVQSPIHYAPPPRAARLGRQAGTFAPRSQPRQQVQQTRQATKQAQQRPQQPRQASQLAVFRGQRRVPAPARAATPPPRQIPHRQGPPARGPAQPRRPQIRGGPQGQKSAP